MKKIAWIAMTCALLMGGAFADDGTDPSTAMANVKTDATVQLTAGSVAAGIGYVWGHGKLTYQGADHPFAIEGVSVVDVGGAKITASGEVMHLAKLSDFEGNYIAWGAGLTIAGGGSATYLRNNHGVVIKLISTTVGLRFNLSTNGVNVKLKN